MLGISASPYFLPINLQNDSPAATASSYSRWLIFFVLTRFESVFYPVFRFIIPVAAYITNKSFHVPVGQVDNRGACYSVFYIGIIEHFIDYHFGNGSCNLAFK